MIARAVIGANFGDEGKGLVTDYLAQTQGAGVVIRFNGGAQAGHTVVRPDGRRHVFHHFGAASFLNIPTYLSEFFIVNPIAFCSELRELEDLGVFPFVAAHPDCLVTTFADMIINQNLESSRANSRHGSVGMGINETVERSQIPELKITMGQLWNNPKTLEEKLYQICTKYSAFRTGKEIDKFEPLIEAFIKGCEFLSNRIEPLGIAKCKHDPIFEGAQGLLLDQNNKENFPHVTRSNTGMKNVRHLMHQMGIDEIETYYVSRTYLTKHGAGPLTDEDPVMKFDDETNVPHPFQGKLRFAPLNYTSLRQRCKDDFGSDEYKLVLTHCDQLSSLNSADLYSYGPTCGHLTSEG